MDLKKQLKTDSHLEEGGVWIDYEGYEGVRLKIARNGNLQQRKWLSEKMRVVARKYGQNPPMEQIDSIAREARARFVLLDWMGITEDDAPVPYSTEKALEYLTELRDFDEFVAAQSLETANFKVHQVEDEKKISKSVLNGNSRGENTSSGSNSSHEMDSPSIEP